MPAAETPAHARLKALALAWARGQGFAECAAEVRIPRSGYRADVAACGGPPAAPTAVFECKQGRADLLRDAHPEAANRARLAGLLERRGRLEGLLAVHRPDLRRGEALFPEYDSFDFSTLRHAGYQRLLGDLARTRRRIRHGCKFSRLARYRCADLLYLVVVEGILEPPELPADWGLLVASPAGLAVARPARFLEADPARRTALRDGILGALRRPAPGSTSAAMSQS